MELTKNITEAAEKNLRFDGSENLPTQIGTSAFYVAAADDQSILAHGVIKFQGVEYKIGTKK